MLRASPQRPIECLGPGDSENVSTVPALLKFKKDSLLSHLSTSSLSWSLSPLSLIPQFLRLSCTLPWSLGNSHKTGWGFWNLLSCLPHISASTPKLGPCHGALVTRNGNEHCLQVFKIWQACDGVYGAWRQPQRPISLSRRKRMEKGQSQQVLDKVRKFEE